jgi:hypothetical protein
MESQLSRIATSLSLLVGLTVFAPAFGQVVQYQFTPPKRPRRHRTDLGGPTWTAESPRDGSSHIAIEGSRPIARSTSLTDRRATAPSITSLAMASNVGGMSMPIAGAVWRL